MGAFVIKRLLIALVAVAFIGANMPASCLGGGAMETAAAMTHAMDDPCSDCLGHAPTMDLAKMGCGALACAGIVGLSTRQIVVLPDFGKYLHPSDTEDEMAGISLKPDPFPPRPTVRV